MRVQLALNVDNLDESIEFYSKMFDTEPYKVKDGYANFAIAQPPLKLVLFEQAGNGGTLNHLGVEVEDSSQVEAAEARIAGTGLSTTGVDDVLCCYAGKTETWVEGPDTRWEWYVKTSDVEVATYENVSPGDVVGDATVCCTPDSIAG
ncbi:MAG: ArsI/CadI family heavy metal resistance metalloenzyme [Actinomycetota bacterium]